MRFARIATQDGLTFAVIDGEGTDPSGLTARQIAGTPFTEPEFTGQSWPLAEVRLLAPTLPTKVIGIEENFAADGPEVAAADPESDPTPTMFLKPPTSVVGPGAPIRIPDFAREVEFEGELGLVIGTPCKSVDAANWRSVVRGVTIINDVTSRELQGAEGQWARAKGIDTFCPLGPWIETDLSEFDFEDLHITGKIARAGVREKKQESNTGNMVMTCGEIIEYVSSCMTLLPGDVISTGAPARTAEIMAGDNVSIEIPGIGVLENPVVNA